ncbi:hypothetical protein PV326_009606, partial [Microctonus aethiopoides]
TADRIKDMIYMSVDGVAACFRRHNGTHQFGCSSSRGGSVGVIQILDGPDDLGWLETNATAESYMIVMPISMFTQNIIERLEATNIINGILVTKNSSEENPSSYSPEATCPNKYSSHKMCDVKNPWNPLGNNFLLKDWKFPIFYIENNDLVMKIKDCYYKHNAHDLKNLNEKSLCALEMQSFMSAAVNSESCIRRSQNILYVHSLRFCDPLGDRNIHWPLSPLTNETKSVTLVMARLDANSMFDGFAPGANSAVTGFVTLLATAYYLNSLNATISDTNVLFSLMNGEAFDYIGSSRFVYDLEQGNFDALAAGSLKLDSINTIIELGQLGNSENKLYLHANNYMGNNLIEELQKTLSLENTTISNSVPPASIQSFLAVRPNLTAVVIADHGNQFTNKYYGGILDNNETIAFNRKQQLNKTLANIAIKLGDLLYEKVTGEKPSSGNSTVIEELVTEMLSCYLISAQCNLFQAASSPGVKLSNQLFSLYVGVNGAPNIATMYTAQLLALLTGEKLPEMSAQECVDHRLSWMGGYNFTGICINSTVTYTPAVSPAFIIDGYPMQSGLYSTWTESVWQSLSVRMFLKPSAAAERLSITLGSVVAILSFIIVWFIKSRSELLFKQTRTAEDC